MEGLRGVATLIIAYFHVNIWHSQLTSDWLRNLGPTLGVFFLLGGFVLTMIYGNRLKDGRSVADFAVRRVGRVLPMHLFTLGFLLCWEIARAVRSVLLARSDIVTFEGNWSLGELVASIFLVHGWGIGRGLSWNVPSWTLSTELIAYALFVILVLAIKRDGMRLVAALVITVISGLVFAYQTQLLTWSGSRVPWCLQGFFLGYLLCWAWQRWPIRSHALGSAVGIGCLVGCALMLAAGVYGLPLNLLWWLCTAGLTYVVVSESGVLSRVLASKPLRWLGEISLSIYLLHFPVIVVLNHVFMVLERSGVVGRVFVPNPTKPGDVAISFGPLWLMDALVVAYLAVVVGLSAITYHYVEGPGRDFFNRLGARIRRGEIGRPRVALQPTP